MAGFEKCPKCGEEHLEYGNINMDADDVWQTVECPSCGFRWNEVYTFVRCEDVETCEELDRNGLPITDNLRDFFKKYDFKNKQSNS